jgi:hypothetical protein
MDALKDIPDDVHILRTEKGDARLQKTDIFKKLMWFSYPKEENWVPVPIKHVREIQVINKSGELVPDLGENKDIDVNAVKAFDYENVVGQDSLTRLDERSANQHKRNNNNRNKPKPATEGAAKPFVPAAKAVVQAKPAQQNTPAVPAEGVVREGGNPNRRRNRPRPNRNPNNPNNNSNPNQTNNLQAE